MFPPSALGSSQIEEGRPGPVFLAKRKAEEEARTEAHERAQLARLQVRPTTMSNDLLDGQAIQDFLFDDKPPRPRTFKPGDVVVTRRTINPPTDWTPEAAKARRFEVQGTVLRAQTGHGLCYSVRHDDGTVGAYEPQELELVQGA